MEAATELDMGGSGELGDERRDAQCGLKLVEEPKSVTRRQEKMRWRTSTN